MILLGPEVSLTGPCSMGLPFSGLWLSPPYPCLLTQCVCIPPRLLALLPPTVGLLLLLEFGQELLVHPCRPPGVSAQLPLCWDSSLLTLEEVNILEYQTSF